MRTFASALALTLALTSATAAAQAPAPTPPRTQATLDDMEACAGETTDRRRLACYQRLIDDLRKSRTAERDTATAPSPAQGAETNAASPPSINQRNDDIKRIVEDHFEPSYFTAGVGKRLGGDQTNGEMLYEAQIFHNLTFNENFQSLGPVKLRLDAPVRLGLRQLSEDSYPVRTPSYNPGLRLFVVPDFANIEFLSAAKPRDALTYFSVGAFHYSNGQEGGSIAPRATTVPNPNAGRANQRNGNFNTNYFELAAHHFRRGQTIEWARIAARRHLDSSWDDIQQDQYPRYQFTAEARSRYFDPGRLISNIQLRAAATLGSGYDFIVKNPTFPNSIEAKRRDKLNTTMEVLFAVPGITDLAFYLRHDHGYDYYNINFQNRINRLQFGVVTK